MHRKKMFLVLTLTLVLSMLACNMPYLEQSPAAPAAPTDTGFQAPTQPAGGEQPADDAAPAATQPGEVQSPGEPLPPSAGTISARRVTIAATDELSRSGLLDPIINGFRQASGLEVVVELGGSGNAFKLGRKYVADVLLVNNPGNIIEFIEQGHGKERYRILHTDYVILGPEDDPAKIKGSAKAADALKKIADAKAKFVTRGSESDLVNLENRLWKKAGVTPSGDWYVSANTDETDSGNPGTLKLAYDFKAYTLMDRATYAELREKFPLTILVEGDPELFNIYYVVPVNPEKSDKVNYPAAQAFVQYLATPEVQNYIAQFGVDRFGQPIFFADGGGAEQ